MTDLQDDIKTLCDKFGWHYHHGLTYGVPAVLHVESDDLLCRPLQYSYELVLFAAYAEAEAAKHHAIVVFGPGQVAVFDQIKLLLKIESDVRLTDPIAVATAKIHALAEWIRSKTNDTPT